MRRDDRYLDSRKFRSAAGIKIPPSVLSLFYSLLVLPPIFSAISPSISVLSISVAPVKRIHSDICIDLTREISSSIGR